jgi:hypothetical protein
MRAVWSRTSRREETTGLAGRVEPEVEPGLLEPVGAEQEDPGERHARGDRHAP